VVSSATLDAEQFKAFFEQVSPLVVSRVDLSPRTQATTLLKTLWRSCLSKAGSILWVGEAPPVDVLCISSHTLSYADIHYLQSPVPDYLQACVETALLIHQTEPAGDILIFLTGAEEIETCVQLLRDTAAT
jgi:HrpA-like RNA helicase